MRHARKFLTGLEHAGCCIPCAKRQSAATPMPIKAGAKLSWQSASLHQHASMPRVCLKRHQDGTSWDAAAARCCCSISDATPCTTDGPSALSCICMQHRPFLAQPCVYAPVPPHFPHSFGPCCRGRALICHSACQDIALRRDDCLPC